MNELIAATHVPSSSFLPEGSLQKPEASKDDYSKSEVDEKDHQFLTLDELESLSGQDEGFLIDGLLSNAGTSLLIGKPKVGKSQLARQLAAAIANGTPFLNRTTQQGEVVYFALEEKGHEVSAHLRALGADRGVKVCLTASPENPVGVIEAALVASPEAKLIIVDPLSQFAYARDWDKYGEMGRMLRPIHQFARSRNVHVLVVHHAGKRERDNVADNTLGSTALNGGVDTIVHLASRQGTRVLAATPRYAPQIPPTNLIVDGETMSVSIDETKGESSQRSENATIVRISTEIQNFLSQNENQTQAAVRDAVRGNAQKINETLDVLVGQGAVLRIGTGRSADPYLHSLATIPAETVNHSGGFEHERG